VRLWTTAGRCQRNAAGVSVAPRDMIASEYCNAEWALKTQTETLVVQFNDFEDAYLRERQTDVTPVVVR